MKSRLHDLESMSAQERSTMMSLEARKTQSASEIKRYVASLATCDAEMSILREQVKDLNSENLKLANSLEVCKLMKPIKLQQAESFSDRSISLALINKRVVINPTNYWSHNKRHN